MTRENERLKIKIVNLERENQELKDKILKDTADFKQALVNVINVFAKALKEKK